MILDVADLYRRHSEKCKHRDKGPGYTKCTCPIWAYGRISEDHPPIRESMKTRNWEKAQKRLKDRIAHPEAGGPVVRLSDAVDRYNTECERRELAEGTVRAYRAQLAHLKQFGAESRIQECTPEFLTRYRATREIAASTSRKELETLRGFCDFCRRMGWLSDNPASFIKPPRDTRLPTMPFSQDEVLKILAACETMPDRNPKALDRTRQIAKARVLVMLYGGLRISDTVTLKRSSVDMRTGRCFLRMMKTQQPLYVTLERPALDALEALPMESGEYFFWSGRGSKKAAIGGAQRSVARLMTHAGITNGHPHRFRDTFSVRILEQGGDLWTVKALLGHTSIKTTERHYAPWVRSMQRLLDAATSRLDFVSDVQKTERENFSQAKVLKMG